MVLKNRKVFRYWLLTLLAIVAVIIIIFYLKSSESTPEPTPGKPETQNLLEKPKIFGTDLPTIVETNLQEFPLPKQLRIFQGEDIKTSLDQAKKIAKEFNFTGSPQITEDKLSGTFYYWNTEKENLMFNPGKNILEYSLNLRSSKLQFKNPPPLPDRAKEILENFLNKFQIKLNEKLVWQKEIYLLQGLYFQTTNNSKEANFIRIGFNPALGEYQLVGQEPKEPLISMIIGPEEKIVRFRTSVYFTDFKEKELYQLRTESEIKKTLATEGKVVYYNAEKVTEETILKKALFNQIQLAYFQEPEKNSSIQPIYILTGTGTLKDGQETEVIVYLPAIASKHFKTTKEHFSF